MELTRKNIKTSEKIILKNNATKDYFENLIFKAIKRYGRKSEGKLLGFNWPNAHKDIFYAGGYEFKLEFCSEFDFFD